MILLVLSLLLRYDVSVAQEAGAADDLLALRAFLQELGSLSSLSLSLKKV